VLRAYEKLIRENHAGFLLRGELWADATLGRARCGFSDKYLGAFSAQGFAVSVHSCTRR